MTPTIAHKVPMICVAGVSGSNTHATVTLPAPPWGDRFDRDDRPATAPRGRIIRANRRWDEDPVIMHANKRTDRG